jgi:hypothetical protein
MNAESACDWASAKAMDMVGTESKDVDTQQERLILLLTC